MEIERKTKQKQKSSKNYNINTQKLNDGFKQMKISKNEEIMSYKKNKKLRKNVELLLMVSQFSDFPDLAGMGLH